ncbi:MAG: hypothetical protein MI742_12685 [Desulfobacterales bacterium]|nr:hypothetical protein [Desulfobacterales bacterium]
MDVCKECGVALEKDEVCMVAHWAFCKSCFDALMTKEETAPPPKPEVKALQCNVCDAEVPEGEGKMMLGLLFCQKCYHALTHRPPAPEPAEEEEDIPPAFKTPQVEVDNRETISCDGCGRTIPKLGASPLGESLLCPDCFYREKSP